MLPCTQSANTPVSSETGIINRKWQAICFYLEKHRVEQQIESILRAAAGHESNSLPVGSDEYQVLSDEATVLCEEFADRWGLDTNSLRAKIPALSKLDALSRAKQPMNLSRVAWVGVVAIPLALFIIGALAGLVSLGFHLAGGR